MHNDTLSRSKFSTRGAVNTTSRERHLNPEKKEPVESVELLLLACENLLKNNQWFDSVLFTIGHFYLLQWVAFEEALELVKNLFCQSFQINLLLSSAE